MGCRTRFTGCLFSLVFFIFGAVFFAVPIVMQVQMNDFLTHAVPGIGEVIDMESVSSSDGPDTYRPVVRFLTREERAIVFTEGNSEYPPRFSVGDVVDVLYDPSNPAEAHLKQYTSILTNPLWIIFLILGGIVALVGLSGMVTSFVRRV